MKNLFKKLFCKHIFSYLGMLKCTYEIKPGDIVGVPVSFYQCLRCGKRMVIKDKDIFYTKPFLQKVALWQRSQLEINFEDKVTLKGEKENE